MYVISSYDIDLSPHTYVCMYIQMYCVYSGRPSLAPSCHNSSYLMSKMNFKVSDIRSKDAVV